ncbi:MAG: dephospho-CoA kinase [Candidatus Omnitrophica bacterium]|nr:dephospho-CoA kinase [Candidatus Omnitrophota bacterium]
MKKFLIVGITGILGSGKTTVSEIIKKMGFKLISCDAIVNDLLEKKRIINKFKKILGEDILTDGKINRKIVRKIIFNDISKKREIESLLHPIVFKKIKEKILDIKEKDGIIFIEIPLLFETKSEKLFDKIIVVSAPLKEIKKRLIGKYSEEEIEKIWKSQLSISYKKKRADYILNNSGSILETEKKVKKIIKDLLRIKGEQNGRN